MVSLAVSPGVYRRGERHVTFRNQGVLRPDLDVGRAERTGIERSAVLSASTSTTCVCSVPSGRVTTIVNGTFVVAEIADALSVTVAEPPVAVAAPAATEAVELSDAGNSKS